jgi:hypothetical protein
MTVNTDIFKRLATFYIGKHYLSTAQRQAKLRAMPAPLGAKGWVTKSTAICL